MSSQFAYRPEIDGLRAIAVLSVILFHTHEPLLPGGFVGVDIFFVISGFLITSIIDREIVTGRFSVARFYERRIRRIFPSLFLVLLVCLPFAWWLMTPDQMQNFSQSVLATSVFLSNVYFYLKTGYFEQSAHVLPLLHTWSLAVEEQYYVLFPLLMLVLARGPRALLLLALIALFSASLVLSILWGESSPMFNFFMLATRGWELLAGALLALTGHHVRPFLETRVRLRQGLELAGILGLAHGVLLLDKSVPFPGLAALPVVFGTVLLIASMTDRSLVGRLLASKPAVGIGLISYSAYLWHQPVLAFARIGWSPLPPAALIALFVLTMGLAYLSWRFVEKPFRNRAWLTTRMVLSGGTAMIVLFCVIGAAGHLQRGFAQRYDAQTLALAATAEISPFRSECHTEGLEYRRPSEACVYVVSPASWAVFGDSHGVEIALALSEPLSRQQDGVIHLTFSGCAPALDFSYSNPGCHEWVNETLAFLESSDSILNVMLVYRSAFHLYGEHGVHGDDYEALRTGSAPLFLQDAGAAAARAAYWKNLDKIVGRLTEAGKSVYLLSPVPELPLPIERLIFDTSRPIEERRNASTPRQFLDARLGDINAQLATFDGNKVHVLRLDDILCDTASCIATQDGTAYYFDDNHLSMAGARAVIRDLIASADLTLESKP
ncbi:acyltransferase family protein [Meridianimarinicoccus aquatilis]|uniref:Acyltransferase n=1 Tax=Meridianimarinicoccus aquatilis TaxID=2552766 RepID=A0A4R6AV77_9RHOB|nr:acyltransferase family protein [Fluviibacterium aquatile]TDL88130.1 acyltransferase [Fluviibacterium aquatile]